MPGNGNDNNPWGSKGSKDSGKHNPWGAGGPGDTPPDIDEMFRKAQENLRDVMPGNMGGGKFIGLALLAAITLWLASGLYTIEPGVHGVIQRFGAWNRTQTVEGLGYHLPWPFETATMIKVAKVREMPIGFSAISTRGNIASKRDIPEESLMLTSDANIVDLDLVVQWDIKSAEDFIFNIRDQENTIKKVAESAIREVVGQTEMFPIITQQRQQVADRARAIMIKNLDDYKSGVGIRQVLIQNAEVHPDVQSAFQDVQSAKQDAEDVQNRAEAYREDILPKARGAAIEMLQKAEGYKQSVVARSKGDADRFKAVLAAYQSGKDVTRQRMYIETMEEVMKNAQKIILDENGSGSGVVPYLPLNELKRGAQ